MSTSKKFKELIETTVQSEEFLYEKTIISFVKMVDQPMKKHKVSRTEIAKRMNSSQAYVTKILRGNSNFTLKSMVKLVHVLGGRLNISFGPAERYQCEGFVSVDEDENF